MTATEVQGALQHLGARLTADGHYLQAIKCYVTLLGMSLLPADEAVTLVKLAQLLMAHTHNITDARQHLQRAEMLVMPLPAQQQLKCEVLAHLSHAYKLLGETDFQQQCLLKGLGLSKEDGPANNMHAMADWAVYFHLHTAESYTWNQQCAEAAEQAQAAGECAQQHGLSEQQMLCLLFQLQLAILVWDQQQAEQLVATADTLLQQLEQTGSSPFVAQLKLHCTLLQMVFSVHLCNFQDLIPGPSGEPPIIADMEAQAEAVTAADNQAYSWLSPAGSAALVQLLAASILKPAGKVKPALVHISRGLQLVSDGMSRLGLAPTATDAAVDHTNIRDVRVLLMLQLLLQEARQQLHLLSSDFSAARQDVAQSMELLARFPSLLASLESSVHLQAGLYAQAVGANSAALAHFSKAASSQDSHLQGCARCLAAVSCLAQDVPGAVSRGRELLGELASAAGTANLTYAERAASHIAAGLLALAGPEVTADETLEAKQRLSKALKLAHGRLQNHQLVSQVLLFMTPLQVKSADAQGGLQMVTSSFTLAKGAGDLHTQVAGLSMMQQLYHYNKQPDKAAQNYNYLGRKQDELSSRIQQAESNTRQHVLVLQWGL